ncbi:hypothetical protein BGZ47_002532, partial [Haplosporangium gracile]
MPVQWLPEIYAAQKGGDTRGFMEGLRIMSKWNHFSLRASMRNLLFYCESDRGQKQLQLLRSFSSLQAEADDLAVNIGVRSVELYKGKVAGNSNEGDHSSKAFSAGDRKRPYDKLHNDSAEVPPSKSSADAREESQDDANGVGPPVKVYLQQEADSDSDTAVEATPATMESELTDGDTETEANLETLESELSLPKAKNSPFYELVDYIYKK